MNGRDTRLAGIKAPNTARLDWPVALGMLKIENPVNKEKRKATRGGEKDHHLCSSEQQNFPLAKAVRMSRGHGGESGAIGSQ